MSFQTFAKAFRHNKLHEKLLLTKSLGIVELFKT